MNPAARGGRSRARAREIACLLAGLLAGCLFLPERGAGRGSEVENEVYGVMVDASGLGVAGARVLAYPADPSASAPAAPRDSDVTDAEGRYSLAALTPGAYNVIGDFQEGRLAVLIPDVRYAPGPGQDLGADTLYAPGGIEGRVVQGGAGKAGVLAYIPGTSFLAVTDAEGGFLMPWVPRGVHRVSYQAAGYRADPDTGVVVESGRITRLPDKVLAYDTALPPPSPARIGAALDTATGVVRLRWSPVEIADRLGYKVYRDAGPLSLPAAVSGILEDTVFQDTLRAFPAPGAAPHDIGYRIRTVDREWNEGAEFSPAARVSVVSPATVATRLDLRMIKWNPDVVGVGETTTVLLEFANPVRLVRSVEWSRDGARLRTREFASRTGADTLRVSWPEAGNRRVEVRAFDESGSVWQASIQAKVVADLPVAMAGADTALSVGDTLKLRPDARDLLGRVVRWEWDIGATGVFREAPYGVLDIRLPVSPMADYPCILRVTDDGGNIGLDTLFVDALADPPAAAVSAWPREAMAGDTVILSAAASRDGFGRIVSWEWDIGGTGAFVPSPDGEFRFSGAGAGAVAGSAVPIVLRVTDDDGQTDTAAMVIPILDQDSWVPWESDVRLRGWYDFNSWVFRDRFWLLGKHPSDSLNLGMSLWRTGDMRTWERVMPSGLDEDWSEAKAVVHAEKIWMAGFSPPRIWRSADGVGWQYLPAPPELHNLHSWVLCSHAGKLWILGVRDTLGTRRGEVWYSEDGTDWTLATAAAAFGDHVWKAAISWKGRLWASGHEFADLHVASHEIWSSADGRDWRLESPSVFPGARTDASLFPRGEALWTVSTKDYQQIFRGEARYSPDGSSWSAAPVQELPISGRSYVRAEAFLGRVWLLTSTSDRERKPMGVIWRGPW